MIVVLTTEVSPNALESFLKIPEIYDNMVDDLTPAGSDVNLLPAITHEDVLNFGIVADSHLVGVISFIRSNSISCRVHVGVLKGFGGKLLREAGNGALSQVFNDKGMLKITAGIPSFNKSAILLARHMGFKKEGSFTKSFLKNDNLYDIELYGLNKDVWSNRLSVRKST